MPTPSITLMVGQLRQAPCSPPDVLQGSSYHSNLPFPLFSFISPPSTPRGHFPNTTYTQALDLRSASGTPVSDHHVRAWCQTGSDLGRGEDIFNPTKQNLGPDHRSSLALVPSGQSPFLSLPPGQAGWCLAPVWPPAARLPQRIRMPTEL